MARSPSYLSIGAIWPVSGSGRCMPRAWRSARKRGHTSTAVGFPSRRLRSTSCRRASSVRRTYTAAIAAGATTVHFPAAVCQPCALRAACTTARRRSVTIHAQEALLQTLRARQHQPEGRAQLRHRTTVEHSLARVGQIQGGKARYKGARKNTLDVRRIAVVTNLQRLARLQPAA
jgi:hypothetical protein